MPRLPVLASLVLSSAAAVPAQTTHIVGPGGHPQIANAIAVAVPGDIVVVYPGGYLGFNLTKGLTIRALVPGTVTATGLGGTFQIPLGETAHLVGMRMGFTWVTSGSATFDQCSFDLPHARLQVGSASVHLQDCVLRPAPIPSLLVVQPTLGGVGADITAVGCTIEGMDAVSLSPPSVAIDLVSSTFRGSMLTVRGGNGQPTAGALRADAASRVWLCDSTVTSDPASCPLVAVQGRHARCVLTPACSTIPGGFVLGVRRPLPPQSGGTFVLELTASPGAPIGVFAALGLERSTWPSLEQELLLPVGTAFPLAALVAGANGLAVGAWQVPLGAADVTLWLQAFAGPASPLQASAVVGGVVR